ncbi:hypothetical protein GALMADRAFT_148208 [Galerina marginata CBS 339.88]|uniref:Uncharacterized protein n=1 Tax=Galerina marginata (strain CBS 339.88) TaxID=685588 RepID=A0A067SE94_GALM3|nr:hypothetical protein GALMADRAFT_148208 [Galerina marginata CBS 339.88]
MARMNVYGVDDNAGWQQEVEAPYGVGSTSHDDGHGIKTLWLDVQTLYEDVSFEGASSAAPGHLNPIPPPAAPPARRHPLQVWQVQQYAATQSKAMMTMTYPAAGDASAAAIAAEPEPDRNADDERAVLLLLYTGMPQGRVRREGRPRDMGRGMG